MEGLKEKVVDYLIKNYHCGWNNTIRDNETNAVIDINFIVNLMSDTFSLDTNVAEAYVLYYLIEQTLDAESIVTYWSNNRERTAKPSRKKSKGRNLVSSNSYEDSMSGEPDDFIEVERRDRYNNDTISKLMQYGSKNIDNDYDYDEDCKQITECPF